MRKNIAAGNWKMNTNLSEGKALANEIVSQSETENCDIIICVPFTHLTTISDEIKNNTNIFLGAQNIAAYESGAYTGEINGSMLSSCGVDFVLVGHSERRQYFNESSEVLKTKIRLALDAGLQVIYCLGEPLEIREAGDENSYIKRQLEDDLFSTFSTEDLNKMVIAYEPIWAIGTGKTASSQQAQDMHAHIRSLLREKYGSVSAENTSILYGGSVKPDNAEELFSMPDVDGGLVGGASLKHDSFLSICKSF